MNIIFNLLHTISLLILSLFDLKTVWTQREFGLEDFNDIRESNSFVDKTLLLRKVFREYRHLLITAPKYFGKSINIEMMSLFLRNDQNQSQAAELFKDTKIMFDDKFVSDHMHKYPVVYCNFDSELEVFCTETLLTYYRQILYGIFIEHDYLKLSPALTNEQRQLFTTYIDENEDLEKWKIENGLKFLTECLHLHHAKKVIVLIDEYDAIVVNEIFREENATMKSDDEYFNITREIVSFQSNLISCTLEDNNHIERAILTGTMALSIYQNSSSSPTKIKHIGFTQSTDFIQFYGFTQKEVKGLVNTFNLTNNEETEIQKWYDGYSSERGKVRVVNPWVVTKYLEDKLAYDYWVKLCPIKDILLPLMDNPKIKETLVRLVQESVELIIQLKERFMLNDLENLKKIVHKRWDSSINFDTFYQLLLHMGYLTFERPIKRMPKNSTLLKIPNKEIRHELSKMIKQYFSNMREEKKK